jgi:hypothetical protein
MRALIAALFGFLLFIGSIFLVAAGVKAIRQAATDPRDVGGNVVCESCSTHREHPHGIVFSVGMAVFVNGGGR